MSRRSDMHGFTLIELMITLALLTIVLAIAVPNFTAFIQKTQLQGQADDLISILQYARSEAVIRRTSVDVTVNDAGPWNVTIGGQQVRQLGHNVSQAKMDANVGAITYRPNGTATPAVMTVCRDDTLEAAFVVEVHASGAPTLHPRGKDTDGSDLASCAR